MKRFIAKIFILAVLLGSLSVPLAHALPLAQAAPAHQLFAATDPLQSSKNDVCGGVGLTGGSCAGSATGVGTIIKAVITILSIVVGVAAVIMIVIGGLKYVTSGGESAATASAKNTVLYALIGLVIAGLAQVLVHYVLGNLK